MDALCGIQCGIECGIECGSGGSGTPLRAFGFGRAASPWSPPSPPLQVVILHLGCLDEYESSKHGVRRGCVSKSWAMARSHVYGRDTREGYRVM